MAIVPHLADRSQAPTRAKVIQLHPGRYFSVDNALLDVHAKTIGSEAVTVYLILCRYANHRTKQCWPSIAHIVDLTGLARSTVKAALKRLYEAGLIDREERWDAAGDHTTNLYTLLDPSPAAVHQRQAALAQRQAQLEGGRPPHDPPQVGRHTAPNQRTQTIEPRSFSSFEDVKEKEGPDPSPPLDPAPESPITPVEPPTPAPTLRQQTCPHRETERIHTEEGTVCTHCWTWVPVPPARPEGVRDIPSHAA
jgi:DNA-binding transcriptional ArsR family regulator